MAGNAAPPGISDVQREHWNHFIDYLDKAGYKGNPKLDDRNMQLGQGLLNKFNQANPGSTIKYEDVPMIQTALQQYRGDLIKKWKSGQAEASPDIKTEADLMPGLSKIDGWLGSKTSSYKFPVAKFTNTAGQTQDFGVATGLYDAMMDAKKKQ